MKQAIGGLSDQIAEAASDMGAVAQEPAKQGLKYAAANVDPVVAGASDHAGPVAKAAQLQASWIGDTLEDRVRERPLPTVALALGLGFLIGLTLRR